MVNKTALATLQVSVLILLMLSALAYSAPGAAGGVSLSPRNPVSSVSSTTSTSAGSTTNGVFLSLTVELCQVRQGSIQTSTCAPSLPAGDYAALYVSASVVGSYPYAAAAVTVSGPGSVPIAWTSAWNQQPSSSCGGSPCENGFYGAVAYGGSYSGYSYCDTGSCGYSGQGAASVPAGDAAVTVCVGGVVCASVTVGSVAIAPTVEMCKVANAAVEPSTCSATAPAGEVASLFVSTSGLDAGQAIQVSGPAGLPLAWQSAWNSQPCGPSTCENGYYGVDTNSTGGVSVYSYCTTGGCDGGATYAPPAGNYTVTICTGGDCEYASVTTTGSGTTSTTSSSATTSAPSTSSTSAVTVSLSAASVGFSVFLNATLSSYQATGTIFFNGTGPGGVRTSCTGGCNIGCTPQGGTCGVILDLQPGGWTMEATYGTSHSYAYVTVAGVGTPSDCFGDGAIQQSYTGSYDTGFTYTGVGNTGNFLYVSDQATGSISQYGVQWGSGEAGRLCSLGPPTDLPAGTSPLSMAYLGTTYTGYNSAAGTLLVPSSGRECILGLSADSGDGHLEYGTPYASYPDSCLEYGGLDAPVGSATLVYDPLNVAGCACIYVLNSGNSTISTYASGSQGYRLTTTVPDPAYLVSGVFYGSSFNLGYNTEYCVFADDPTTVQGYAARFGTAPSLLAAVPYSGSPGGFGAMLAYPAAGQETLPPVLYILSPAYDQVDVFQVQAGCSLLLVQTLPTGSDPVGLVTAGSGTALFVLNGGGSGAPSTISSYRIGTNGYLQALGGVTFAGTSAVAIGGGDQLGNLYPYFQDSGFFYVADGGQSSIDEYLMGPSGLPQYVGSIPGAATPGDRVTFASADTEGPCTGCRYSVNFNEFGVTSLSCATPGTPYTHSIVVDQGAVDSTGPVSIFAGSLPPGLSISTGGTISGTPTTAGNYVFSVEESGGSSVLTGAYSISVLSTGCTSTLVVSTTTSTTTAVSTSETTSATTVSSSPSGSTSSASETSNTSTSAGTTSTETTSAVTAVSSTSQSATSSQPASSSSQPASSSSSAAPSTTGSSLQSSTAGGAVPEFPPEAFALAAFTALLAAAYILARRSAMKGSAAGKGH